MNEKVFVISLPRTGTTTLCNMLNTVGYKAKHTPSCFYDKWVREGYNAFADTPCYSLSFIKEQSIYPNTKFIYIERDVNEWINSFESISLHENYERIMKIDKPEDINVVILNEIKSYGELFGFSGKYSRERFIQKAVEHKEHVKEILSDSILFYNFNQGWHPFCKFLGKPVPEIELPKLNQKKRADNY